LRAIRSRRVNKNLAGLSYAAQLFPNTQLLISPFPWNIVVSTLLFPKINLFTGVILDIDRQGNKEDEREKKHV
jgi:hypothetical protein